MDENAKINSEENKEITIKKKVNAKLLAVIGLACVAVIAFVVIKLMDGDDAKLADNEIKIGNDVYSFSAEKGIDDFGNVDSKDAEYKGTYIFSVNEHSLGYTNFTIYNGETCDGVTPKSGETKAEDAGWNFRGAFVPGGSYYQYYTSNGVIDWAAIEEDYNKVIADNSFKNLAYYDVLLEACEDTADECIEADDVAGLEEYGTNSYADSKKYIMSILAHAKLYDELISGEIDYFVMAFDMFFGQPASLKVWVYGMADAVEARGFE